MARHQLTRRDPKTTAIAERDQTLLNIATLDRKNGKKLTVTVALTSTQSLPREAFKHLAEHADRIEAEMRLAALTEKSPAEKAKIDALFSYRKRFEGKY